MTLLTKNISQAMRADISLYFLRLFLMDSCLWISPSARAISLEWIKEESESGGQTWSETHCFYTLLSSRATTSGASERSVTTKVVKWRLPQMTLIEQFLIDFSWRKAVPREMFIISSTIESYSLNGVLFELRMILSVECDRLELTNYRICSESRKVCTTSLLRTG